MSCPSTVSHLIKQLLNYSGRPRRLMVLRLELRPSWETFVCAAHCPGTHRHCRRLVGWKAGKHSPEQSITAELVHRQTDLHCTPGKCSPFPCAAPQTSDLPPGFCSPLRHGSCEETAPQFTSILPGQVQTLPNVQFRQLGAVCSCSSGVIHTSAEEGLNFITGLTTHLL